MLAPFFYGASILWLWMFACINWPKCDFGLDLTVLNAVELKPKAIKDLRRLSRQDAVRVVDALTRLENGFSGDVKRLANFSPEYRLRDGSHRVLFELENGNRVVVYRILHRRDYRQR
jgi:mRNA interferase RelE/StbE